jgi:hypothetical protein
MKEIQVLYTYLLFLFTITTGYETNEWGQLQIQFNACL